MDRPLGYEALRRLAAELGRPATTLMALSYGADPFNCGAPSHCEWAQWFAVLWKAEMPERGGHLRRLHYRLVSMASPIVMIDGENYENTMLCWSKLVQAGKWARYLKLVDADALDDKRSPDPVIYLPANGAISSPSFTVAEPSLYWVNLYLNAPEMPDPPRLAVYEPGTPRVPQRYHVEIFVEKSDVEDICLPLARRYGLNYQQFIGQAGIKPCRQLVERAERSGRPCRILYLSDFDPQGEAMPVAVARKIEFILAERGLDLDIQLVPLALTKQQCIDLDLPRIPVKDSDSGKKRWEERHGGGQTELNALEALHPGLLRRMLVEAIERFHDDTLDQRVEAAIAEAVQELSEEAEKISNSVSASHDAELSELRDGLGEINEALEPIREALEPIQERMADWRSRVEDLYGRIADELREAEPEVEIDLPEPKDGDEFENPLFDSTRSYVDQIEVYLAHRGRSNKAGKPGRPKKAEVRDKPPKPNGVMIACAPPGCTVIRPPQRGRPPLVWYCDEHHTKEEDDR